VQRADRLFDLIQILRTARGPLTAEALAAQLEVTPRTIYRDMATLQARRIPVEGAAGIGYVLRKGFDLPPLMFTADEIDAIAVGALLVRRIRDPGLQKAARSVLGKITTILPDAVRHSAAAPFYVSDGSAAVPMGIDLALLRRAIRGQRTMWIAYRDEKGARSERTIWPLAMAYYVDATVLGAWCVLRGDYRNFRVERIAESRMLEERFPTDGGRLLAGWHALRKERPGAPGEWLDTGGAPAQK